MLPVDDIDPRSPSPGRAEPDAHGQAALLLTESLVHSLLGKASLTNAEAIEVIETAQDVMSEVGTSSGESARRIQEALHLLSRMAARFKTDQP